MLSLDGLQRRAVGNSFLEFYKKVKTYQEGMLHRRFIEHEHIAIVLFNFYDSWDEETFYKLFEIIFKTFAFHYHYKHRTFLLIGINQIPHFAFKILKDYERFSPEDEEIIKANIKELDWFTDYSQQSKIINEFPK